MLVLTRGMNQRIVIKGDDDKIVINVVKIEGNKVRIGIEAADYIKIFREEIINDDDQDNKAA